MSDSGYTPSMERVEDLFAWAVAWDASKHEDRPDLAKLQVQQRAEFQRALAAHDAVIREDQAKKNAAIAEVRAQEYMSNINAVWANQARMNMDSRMGAGFSLNELATLLLAQSFTGTEKT